MISFFTTWWALVWIISVSNSEAASPCNILPATVELINQWEAAARWCRPMVGEETDSVDAVFTMFSLSRTPAGEHEWGGRAGLRWSNDNYTMGGKPGPLVGWQKYYEDSVFNKFSPFQCLRLTWFFFQRDNFIFDSPWLIFDPSLGVPVTQLIAFTIF